MKIITIDNKSLKRIFLDSIVSKDLGEVISCIEQGVEINTYNGEALKTASINGYFEIVEYLISKGANIHVDNDFSLKIAGWNGNVEVVKILVENGIDVYARNNYDILKQVLFEVRNLTRISQSYITTSTINNRRLEIVEYLESVINEDNNN